MGINVHLAVMAERVSDAAWSEIYERARRVANQWKPRPLGMAWRHIGEVRVAQYGVDLETAEGLSIVGDAETLTTGESFMFPPRLARATPRRGRASKVSDVLVAVAQCSRGAARSPPYHHLLGAKTQGLPYHSLIVALGLLVEHSLPGTAVVYGDLSVRDGEQARRGLAAILGEEIEPPVVMDVERLRRRLASTMTARVLDRTIRDLGPADLHLEAILVDLLGGLRGAPDARVRHELEHVARSCPDPARLATGTRLLLQALVEAIRSSVLRGELRERVEQWGAARAREAIARGTLKRNFRLTSMAWDAIEVADLDELAFLCGALSLDSMQLDLHNAVRAVLENRALRWA